jgi:hypothetical protein
MTHLKRILGLTAGGITLIPFITGKVDRVLEAYARGESLTPGFLMPGCHGSAALTQKPAH